MRAWGEGLVVLTLCLIPCVRSKHFFPQLKTQHFILPGQFLSFLHIFLSLNSQFSRILGHLSAKETVLPPRVLQGTVSTLLQTQGNSGDPGKFALPLLISGSPCPQGALSYLPALPTPPSLLTTPHSLPSYPIPSPTL